MGTGTTVKDFHEVQAKLKLIYPQIERQLRQRAMSASKELRNVELEVLRGKRSGKTYIKPGTGRVKYNKKNKTASISYKTYQGSAPGEPPAVRTNTLRSSFRPVVAGSYGAAIESGVKYAHYLQNGTSKMAQRPIIEPIAEKAKPAVEMIYCQPFKINI